MPTNQLALGSTGPAVKKLQEALVALGVNPGKVDGIFGPKTEAAVKRFQKKVGGVPDGIVGPKTRQAMKAMQGVAGVAKPIVKPVAKPIVKPAAKPATGMAAKLAAAKPSLKKP
jgi:peptidoglycan hydrolase-like protein with peptidoglycan-binding domain